MSYKKLRSELLKKLEVTPQRLSQRANKVRESYGPMSTKDAVCIIAHQEGLNITRYLPLEEVERIRNYLLPAPARTTRVAEVKSEGEPQRVPYKINSRRIKRDSSGKTTTEVLCLLRLLNKNLSGAYEQAVRDMDDSNRLSYRGVANELREILREVIDLLAPDGEVEAQQGFAFEPGRTEPTRKQKLNFIFRNYRDSSQEKVKKVAEEGLFVVEERISRFTTALLARSSRATHTQRDRNELRQILAYLNPALLDLLQAKDRNLSVI